MSGDYLILRWNARVLCLYGSGACRVVITIAPRLSARILEGPEPRLVATSSG